jgi:hypothetical protein
VKEPSQTEAMDKADDISAEVDDSKETLENHVEGCDVLKVDSWKRQEYKKSSIPIVTE